MYQKVFLLTFFLISYISFGQEVDLFNSLRIESQRDESLLPDRMIFTQRLLWGQKGLMRKTKWYPLTKEQREKELKLRRKMLKIHQAIGFATLAGMTAQGVLGTKLYQRPNNYYEIYKTHKTIGSITSISYFTGAGMSLLAPPPLTNKKQKGLNSIKAHKYLASLHFSAMAATNLLAESNTKLHRAAALTAFGTYATAILVFKF